MKITEKDSALSFLGSLEEHLNKCLPSAAEMVRIITAIVHESKESGLARHTNFAEAAFLNWFIAPSLHQFLVQHHGLNKEEARRALLSESFRGLPEYGSGTPARPHLHPFSKVIAATPQAIMKQWKEPGRRSLVRSCPDFALRAPSRHKVVFEGKYFADGGIAAAETALAAGIYQAFFYRALPPITETSKHRSWDYDYACFLAFDATENGSLQKAWNSVSNEVKITGFWEGANIYVMILRGAANTSMNPPPLVAAAPSGCLARKERSLGAGYRQNR